MRGVSFTMGDEEVRLLRQATRLVALVDERYAKRATGTANVRCHELARAVGIMLKLKVVDGVVIISDGIGEHSWLLTPKGNILDVYAPQRLPMVQLIASYKVDCFCVYKPMVGVPGGKINRKMIRLLLQMMRKEKLPALPPPKQNRYRGTTLRRTQR